jgi:hypothetical protein
VGCGWDIHRDRECFVNVGAGGLFAGLADRPQPSATPIRYGGQREGDADALYLCTQEPTTFAEAISTYACGVKTSPTIGAAGDGSPDGRKRTVAAITDGSVTATGTATHWALTDGSRLLASGALSASQAVTSGNTFTLAAFDVRIPAAA